MDWSLYSTIALRLALALIVGAILGLNRWLHHKSAGIRTHSLVAIGSATAVMLISDFVQDDAQAVSRVLQGLITGLGFLGAGVIIREQRSQKVHGLTTAASLWACALIGASFGAGQFVLGGLSLGAILLTLIIGGPLERLMAGLTGVKRESEVSDDPD
ncbi:MgtC/SapB family protein [Polynucleobacter sp. es-GGE-1]|jgi:putative Mg2+ transporter-C (MgtC) family protein|uniref:MgtC/SapB family protein n=1 Tax=unclassified Polynucleobacter TaxID=2640945 RepID=UPI001C20E92A|nr:MULTISPECIES: MgtC/SapB family protein [unclassified Polynucleobacter]MBU3632959.1 MgtC/SapB family protein [Polynucleobacter sp. AP-Feld-500C-C5]MBU3634065.1 MgtC/SapB family protein [Polynucleobacter sp. es-GGE-1]MEA9599284.1 MgtC/SapB family protein [Polynucleobacter sp. AP-Sanab-80-C2]QWD71305.1 MgtC/SapB family protein [Polynucleobacter sp. UB-Siik-W21]